MKDLFNSKVIDDIRKTFSGYVVVTDDGHGWFTKGKRSFTDPPFYENEFNSIVEAKLMMLLDFCGIEHYQLSPGSIDTELGERDQYEHELYQKIIAKGKKPIGVSIHCDGFREEQNDATGFCVHYYEKDEKSSETGRKVARAVADAIIASDKANNTYLKPRHHNGIKGANFLMLRETNAVWILIENAFMTNNEDLELLKSDSFRNDRALAILTGLYNYIKQ
jgi:N-acetylmuramoyl-L-alanine amidase